MIKAVIGAVLVGAWASVAMAQEMPTYDVEAYCERIANTIGGSQSIKQGCLEQEQGSYDALKSNWASLPDQVRTYCDGIARTIGGTYAILQGCVQQEEEAGEMNKNFQFKR